MTKDKPRFELSAVQVIGGALAAASAAVAASMLGVGGTVIGAAVASVVTTVGSAMYTHSVRRGRYAIEHARTARLTRIQPVDATADEAAETPETVETAETVEPVETVEPAETPDEKPTDETAAAEPEAAPERPAESGGADGRSSGWRDRFRGINVRTVAVTAACALVLALGLITGVEALLGKPISSALNGDKDGRGTSIGSLAQGHGVGRTTRSPGESPSPSVTRTVTETPTTTPTTPTHRPSTPSPSKPSSTKPTSHAPTPAPSSPSGSASRSTPGGLLP